jgi:hypothetical protein
MTAGAILEFQNKLFEFESERGRGKPVCAASHPLLKAGGSSLRRLIPLSQVC